MSTAGRTGRRRPGWVYGRGHEPDVRFSLANERTFLAWIRTALALLAAGVALDAATRGYSVALVERADYASGTSSRSSKLVHGGLRYLQNFDLGLVREALLGTASAPTASRASA